MTAQYAFDVFRWPRDTTEERLVRFALDDNLVSGWYEHVGYGTGGGGITVHGDHEDATESNIFKRAWVRFMRIDTDPEQEIGGFYLEEGDFVPLSRRERGGRLLTFTGRGGLAGLERYTLGHSIYAPGQDYRGTGPNVPDMWTWRGEPWGAMLVRVIEEGLNAPGAPFTNTLTADFTRDLDSNGNGWNELTDYQTRIGTNGLDLFGTFLQMGAVAQCNGSGLISAYRNLTGFRTDRTSATFASGKLRFEAGVNIIDELPKRLHASSERTHVLTRRGDGQYQTFTSGGSGDPFYGYIEIPHTSDPDAVAALAAQWLEKRAQYLNQATVRHIIGDSPTTGLYAPGPSGDYWVLDLATLHTGDDEHDFDEQSIEVASIRFEHDDAGNWFARTDLGAQYVPTGVDRLSESIYSTIISTPHTHPENLCIPTVPAGELTLDFSERLYFTQYEAGAVGGGAGAGSEDAPNGVTDDAAWDDVSSTAEYMLSPSTTGQGAAVTPWSTVSPTVINVRQGQFFYKLTGDFLAKIQAGGLAVRMQARAKSREGVGISESGQKVISQLGIRVVSADGSTVRGTALALHSLSDVSESKPWRPWSGQSASPYPSENRVFPPLDATSTLTAVPTAEDGDFLVVEPGLRNLQTAVATGGGWDAAGSSGDLPLDETTTTDQRPYIQFTGFGASAGVAGDRHPDLVGDGLRASRCGHGHAMHSESEPSVTDDGAAGFERGDLWAQWDDDDAPTEIVAVWMLLDPSDGAAVWAPMPSPTHSHDSLLPAGGSTGQVLTKQSGDDFDVDWETPSIPAAPVTDHGSMGSTETFDFTDGSDHEGTLDDDLTVTLDGATNGEAAFMTLVLTQDGTGGHSITLPAAVINQSELEAAFDTTASTTNVLTLFTYDGGTTWYGALMGAAPTGAGHYEVLMASGSADPLETSDGLDWLYVFVED